jgi:hypothetical protein
MFLMKRRMKMMTSDEDARIGLSFVLGIRVAANILDADDLGFTRFEDIVDRLEKIVGGELTLLPSGAEARVLFPEATNIEEGRLQQQRDLRVLAKRVLDWLLSVDDGS